MWEKLKCRLFDSCKIRETSKNRAREVKVPCTVFPSPTVANFGLCQLDKFHQIQPPPFDDSIFFFLDY